MRDLEVAFNSTTLLSADVVCACKEITLQSIKRIENVYTYCHLMQ